MTVPTLSERESQDKLRRALAQLSTIQAVVQQEPSHFGITPSLAEDYHRALDHLTAVGHDLEEFRITEQDIRRMDYLEGMMVKSGPRVDRAMFLAKIGSVLTYFQLSIPTDQPAAAVRHIGFGPPR